MKCHRVGSLLAHPIPALFSAHRRLMHLPLAAPSSSMPLPIVILYLLFGYVLFHGKPFLLVFSESCTQRRECILATSLKANSTIDHIGIPIELGAIICVFLMEYSNNAEGVFQWTILKRNLSCK